MKSSATERIEHHTAPESVVEELRFAGGTNRFGEPNFRCVWGYDRIVSIHGEWQEFEQLKIKITAVPADIKPERGEPFIPIPESLGVRAGDSKERIVTKLKSSVIETRLVPKYLPGNCWHLEMWRPPEEYGTREEWAKLGQEVIGSMTVDTAGPYPERGEYELCYPLTSDGTSRGTPIPLVGDVVAELVRMIMWSRNNQSMSFLQRRAAIEQRVRREEEGYVERLKEQLRDGMRPFAGETFVTVPTPVPISVPEPVQVTVPKSTGDKQ